MAWVVYDSNNVIISGHQTEAEADAVKGANTSGIVHDTSGNEADLPDSFTPGWFYYANKTISGDPELSTVDLLKSAALQQRERIIDINRRLLEVSKFYPDDDLVMAHNFIGWSHWGSRAAFLSTSMTAAQKLAWVQQSALGALDLPAGSEENFFGIIRTWTDAERTARNPNARIIVCSPVSPYTRWNIADLKTNTLAAASSLAADPTTAEEINKISSGAWIDDITV